MRRLSTHLPQRRVTSQPHGVLIFGLVAALGLATLALALVFGSPAPPRLIPPAGSMTRETEAVRAGIDQDLVQLDEAELSDAALSDDLLAR